MAKKPLEIDMIAGSQLRDTQGEMLSVEGADISELEAGRGRFNDNHGKGFFNSVGRITKAKKILKEDDCDDDRQKYYWEQIKAPFIYAKGFLYDDEDHPNARAAAAILRNIHKSDTPLKLKASVEGGVLMRGIKDPSLLARTKIHSVALTFTPANNATLVEPLSLDKSSVNEVADMAIIKSVEHLAQTNVPSFRHIMRDASAFKVHDNLQKIADMLQDMGISASSVNLPSKEQILEKALEAKVKTNVNKIKSILRTMKDEELEKAWKDKLAGAAMMGAAALHPTATATAGSAAPLHPPKVQQQAPQVDLSHMPKEHQEAFQKMAKKYPVLGAIGMMESSGGLNYKHEPIKDPDNMHYGHTAGGMFGMMPNSAKFILGHDPKLAAKYPDLVKAAEDMEKNHKLFTDRFNTDPQTAIDFATSFMERNKRKTKNLQMLIHSWNHGLKGTWERYKTEGDNAITSAPYVQGVMKFYQKMHPPKAAKAAKKPKLNKALTAGYGGAGAPTNLTGAGVIQSEVLEPKLKFITCDHCGKEQVYGKHQVKCRDCGQNWSLEQLYRALKLS